MSLEYKNTNKTRMGHRASHIFEAQVKNKRITCSRQNKFSGNRNDLIRKYIYLVNWVVNRLPSSNIKGLDKDDLTGYGTIGLIEAVDRFDPTRNTSFESFAVTRIRGSVYDHLRASDWLTRGSRKKVKNLIKATSELETRLNRYPTDKELAEELSITADELRATQQEAQMGILSLDEPRDNHTEDHATLADNVSSNANSVDVGETSARLRGLMGSTPISRADLQRVYLEKYERELSDQNARAILHRIQEEDKGVAITKNGSIKLYSVPQKEGAEPSEASLPQSATVFEAN